jgi:hypothetical protein
MIVIAGGLTVLLLCGAVTAIRGIYTSNDAAIWIGAATSLPTAFGLMLLVLNYFLPLP